MVSEHLPPVESPPARLVSAQAFRSPFDPWTIEPVFIVPPPPQQADTASPSSGRPADITTTFIKSTTNHGTQTKGKMLRSDEEPAQTTVDLGSAGEDVTVPPNYTSTGPASPVNSGSPKKKLQFNMSSKIQIIPNNRQGQLNTGYLATLEGVLKVAEVILAFVAFVLSICADRRSTTAAWTEHITFETMIVVAALILGYVCFPHLTLKNEPTREGLIVVELLFYGVNTLFYFIAIWLMVHLSASWGTDGRGAAIMSAIVCVALTVLFAIETVLKLKAWRGENEPSSRVVQTGNVAPDSA